jgi:GT2 family glycosyltransferase
MGAYNYEQYVGRAIGSALAQDYPPELLEIIVVDDGSTDCTAEIVNDLVRRYPGRVRLVRQANAGPTAATNRAMAEANGELLCLLDADDIWLPDKTRRQVGMLQARPKLGLVFCDMLVVDAEEAPVRPSLIGGLDPIPQHAFARVLFANVATQSSIMIRASLRECFAPIPQDIPYADWWLALRAAQVSEIDYVREPLAMYRVHGGNLTGGVSGAAAVREHRKYVAFQLWALRHLSLDTLTPAEMLYVWSGVEEQARMVMTSAGSFFAELTPVEPEHAAQADAQIAEADCRCANGDLVAEAALALRALAWNPFRLGARERLNDAVARARAAAALPHPLQGARRFVLLADAEEMLAGDGLLLRYAHELSGSELITLAIDASRLPTQAAERDLRALVQRCELSDRDDIDLLAVIGPQDAAQRHRMLGATKALYRREECKSGVVPVFTPTSLGRLRTFAQTSALSGPVEARRCLDSVAAQITATAA